MSAAYDINDVWKAIIKKNPDVNNPDVGKIDLKGRTFTIGLLYDINDELLHPTQPVDIIGDDGSIYGIYYDPDDNGGKKWRTDFDMVTELKNDDKVYNSMLLALISNGITLTQYKSKSKVEPTLHPVWRFKAKNLPANVNEVYATIVALFDNEDLAETVAGDAIQRIEDLGGIDVYDDPDVSETAQSLLSRYLEKPIREVGQAVERGTVAINAMQTAIVEEIRRGVDNVPRMQRLLTPVSPLDPEYEEVTKNQRQLKQVLEDASRQDPRVRSQFEKVVQELAFKGYLPLESISLSQSLRPIDVLGDYALDPKRYQIPAKISFEQYRKIPLL